MSARVFLISFTQVRVTVSALKKIIDGGEGSSDAGEATAMPEADAQLNAPKGKNRKWLQSIGSE